MLCGIALENAPAGALTAISIGSSYAQLQLFGIPGVRDGCFLHVQLSGPVYLGMLGPQVGSSATFALPLPESLAPLATTTLYFQAIVFDPATGEFESSSAYQRNVGWY